jgi:hypothetical protein
MIEFRDRRDAWVEAESFSTPVQINFTHNRVEDRKRAFSP